MSADNNEGGLPPEAPAVQGPPPADEPDFGPEVDDDFPTYANEANKELNRKVLDVTI
jgi:hypothetical protein